MKKSEFKEMIKESVKEVLVEEGVLKTVISEQASLEAAKKQNEKLAETRKKMLQAIGKESYGGVDLFEGTTPMKNGGMPDASSGGSSALSDVDPSDSGVDISSLLGGVDTWKQLIK